jgi:hypothetical protein
MPLGTHSGICLLTVRTESPNADPLNHEISIASSTKEGELLDITSIEMSRQRE